MRPRVTRALAHVDDHQRAGAATRPVVEAVAPGDAQAKRPDFRERGNWLAIDERVVVGHAIAAPIGIIDTDVDPQHLAQQRVRVLRVVERVAAAPAITKADVQVAVWSKRQVTAVVVRKRWLTSPVATIEVRS